MKNNNNKNIFVVVGGGSIVGVYSTKEKAEQARQKAENLDSLGGGRTFYYIEKAELDKEG